MVSNGADQATRVTEERPAEDVGGGPSGRGWRRCIDRQGHPRIGVAETNLRRLRVDTTDDQ
jgi:hypothetical protein